MFIIYEVFYVHNVYRSDGIYDTGNHDGTYDMSNGVIMRKENIHMDTSNHDGTYDMSNGVIMRKENIHMDTSNHMDNKDNKGNNLNMSGDSSNRGYPDSVLHSVYSSNHNKMLDNN